MTVELATDVAELLQLTKGVTHDAIDLKCPMMQAAKALKSHMTAQQQEEEHLVDHCKQFVSLSKMTDRAHGDISPVSVAKKNMTAHGRCPDGTLLAEKHWMLAFMFVNGHGNKMCRCMCQ